MMVIAGFDHLGGSIVVDRVVRRGCGQGGDRQVRCRSPEVQRGPGRLHQFPCARERGAHRQDVVVGQGDPRHRHAGNGKSTGQILMVGVERVHTRAGREGARVGNSALERHGRVPGVVPRGARIHRDRAGKGFGADGAGNGQDTARALSDGRGPHDRQRIARGGEPGPVADHQVAADDQGRRIRRGDRSAQGQVAIDRGDTGQHLPAAAAQVQVLIGGRLHRLGARIRVVHRVAGSSCVQRGDGRRTADVQRGPCILDQPAGTGQRRAHRQGVVVRVRTGNRHPRNLQDAADVLVRAGQGVNTRAGVESTGVDQIAVDPHGFVARVVPGAVDGHVVKGGRARRAGNGQRVVHRRCAVDRDRVRPDR